VLQIVCCKAISSKVIVPLYFCEVRNVAFSLLFRCKIIVLKAPMQSGKTYVIRHICYLLNVVDSRVHRDRLNIDNGVFLLNHLVDTDLKLQTIRRMKGVMEFPDMNVFHSRDNKLKQISFVRALQSNRVLLSDESHYGANDGGLIDCVE
jgi:hypothetical protein